MNSKVNETHPKDHTSGKEQPECYYLDQYVDP